MTKPLLTFLAGALAVPLLAAAQPVMAKAQPEKISGPFTAQNLTIYFIHGPSQPGVVPLTLGEAMKSGVTTVYETGQVSRLSIENKSDREVFVQAGDIVKGGRQDRVISVSLLIPPRSGRIPIGAFCVEQGRWRKRGHESAAKFHSSVNLLPLRAAKLAMHQPVAKRVVRPRRHAERRIAQRAPPPRAVHNRSAPQRIVRQRIGAGGNRRGLRGGATRQQRVWASVGAMQKKLSRNLKTTVNSGVSESSLQLTLEHKKLAKTRDKLIAALRGKADGKADVIGYVFAVNGKINSGDIYPSNGLFKKMWPRLLAAAATEAISEKLNAASPRVALPAVGLVKAFLQVAGRGKATITKLDKRLKRETRNAKGKAVVMSTRRNDGSFIHRSYVAY